MTMSSRKALRSSIHLILMSLLAFIIGFLMSYDAATMKDRNWDVDDVDGSITALDSAIDSSNGNDVPTTTLELLGKIALKQRQLNNGIIREYGVFGKDIFNMINVEKILQVSSLSKTKLLRKIMIKIVLGRIKNQEMSGAKGNSNQAAPTFHWVTVGDSNAAGHGNAYSQSYTSMLHTTVSSIFQSAGIEFKASNRAGDVLSGMETAFCMKEIYGADVDVLSWDFMPLDSKHFDPLSNSQGLDALLFGERAGMTYYPQLPFLYFLGRATSVDMQQQLGALENRGVGFAMMMESSLREVALTLPDGNDKDRGGKLPAFLSKFHCNGAIEGSDACNSLTQMNRCYSNEGGECATVKYNVPKECANSRYQTPWNDGFKMNRLKGRLLGFQLIEMLRLATLELELLELKQPRLRDNPLETLDLLQDEEEVEAFLFSKTTATATSTEESSWDWLKVKKPVCINALSTLQKSDKRDQYLPIELHPSKSLICEEYAPFQTAFYRTSDREQQIKLDPVAEFNEGVREVMYGVCLHTRICDGDQCEIDPVHTKGTLITIDTVQMSVNGKFVSELTPIGGCYFLANEEGLKWREEAGEESAGELTIRTPKPLFVSSFFALY